MSGKYIRDKFMTREIVKFGNFVGNFEKYAFIEYFIVILIYERLKYHNSWNNYWLVK